MSNQEKGKIEQDSQFGLIGDVIDDGKVIVGRSEKFGRGLFATENIAKGEIIAEFDGRIYTARLASLLPNDPPLYVQNHAVQFSETQYRWSKYGTLTNHSCDPNCGINGNSEEIQRIYCGIFD